MIGLPTKVKHQSPFPSPHPRFRLQARPSRRGPGLGGSRAKKNPPERAFKGEAHVGAERSLRAHNVLAAREFLAEQNFLRCSRSVTLRWKSLSAALEAARQSI